MHTITPHLICAGAGAGAADAMGFYVKAFNAVELSRLPGPDGKLMHAMVKIGNSTLMLVDEMPQWGALGPKALEGSPVTMLMYVTDVDAAFAQAVAPVPPSRCRWPTCSGAIATVSCRIRSAISGRWRRTRGT